VFRVKAPLASLEQAVPGPWPTHGPFPRAGLFLFAMACKILGRWNETPVSRGMR
jgi:hypothetical protein